MADIIAIAEVEPDTNDPYEGMEGEGEVAAIDPKIKNPEALAAKLMGVFKQYKAYKDEQVRPVLEGIRRAYLGMKPLNTGPYKTVYTIREIFRQIETTKANINPQFFDNPDLFKYMPRHPGAEDKVRAATEIVKYQVDKYGIDVEHEAWLDNAVLYGISYLVSGWRKYKRSQFKISEIHDEEDGSSSWDRETKEQIEEAPEQVHVSWRKVFCDHKCEDIRRSPFAFIRDIMSAADLKQLVREGRLDQKVVKKILTDGNSRASEEAILDSRPEDEDADDPLDQVLDGEQPHDVIWCWTNSGMEYVIIDEKYLARGTECDYPEIPILQQKTFPQADEHYGLPMALQILDDQRILNDFMSMFVDVGHFTLNPMYKVAKKARNDWEMVEFKPGGQVYLNDLNDIQPLLTTPGAEMNVANVGQFLLNNMALTSGVTKELSGTGSSTKTATGIVRLQDAASARIKDAVRRFVRQFRLAYRILYNLNARYLNQRVAGRLEGEDGKSIIFGDQHAPDAFEPDVDVYVELGNQMETDPEAQNRALTLFNAVRQDPMTNQELVRIDLWRAFGKRKPKMYLVNSITSQADAMDENYAVRDFGIAPEPNASDDHMRHLQIHQMFMQTPEFMALDPMWQAVLGKHVAIHAAFVQKMQEAQAAMGAGQQQMGPGIQGPGGMPEADARTEAMFNNAQAGANQQGAVAGAA